MIQFVLVNTLYPAIIAFALANLGLPMQLTFGLAVGAAGLLLAANVYFFKTHARHRMLIGVVALFNILALVFFGGISFFTAIPGLLNLLS